MMQRVLRAVLVAAFALVCVRAHDCWDSAPLNADVTAVVATNGTDNDQCGTWDMPCASINGGLQSLYAMSQASNATNALRALLSIAPGSYDEPCALPGESAIPPTIGALMIQAYAGSAIDDENTLVSVSSSCASSERILALNCTAPCTSVVLDGLTFNGGQNGMNHSGVSIAAEEITMTSTAFEQCRSSEPAASGGGAYLAAANSVCVSESTFSSCAASTAGGLHIEPIVAATVQEHRGPSVTIMSSSFDECSASVSHGGGVYVRNASSVAIRNVTATRCTSRTGGSALRIEAFEEISLASSAFSECVSLLEYSPVFVFPEQAGAVQLRNAAHIAVSECTFTENSCAGGRVCTDSQGGGLYAHGSNATVSVDACEFYNNTGGSGGGMFVNATSAAVSASTFSGNKASRGGGGMRLAIQRNATLVGVVARHCYTYVLTGAGVLVSSYRATAEDPVPGILVVDSTIEDNLTYDGSGAGIASIFSALTLRNVTVRGNSATELGPSVVSRVAGVYGLMGSVELIGCSIMYNRKGSGVGVGSDRFGERDCSLTMQDTNVQWNSGASVGAGVAVDANDGNANVLIERSTILFNSIRAPYDINPEYQGLGGGVFVRSGSTASVLIRDTEIQNNEANSGAAVYIRSGGDVLLENVTTTSNYANIYAAGSSVIQLDYSDYRSTSPLWRMRDCTSSGNLGASALISFSGKDTASLLLEDCEFQSVSGVGVRIRSTSIDTSDAPPMVNSTGVTWRGYGQLVQCVPGPLCRHFAEGYRCDEPNFGSMFLYDSVLERSQVYAGNSHCGGNINPNRCDELTPSDLRTCGSEGKEFPTSDVCSGCKDGVCAFDIDDNVIQDCTCTIPSGDAGCESDGMPAWLTYTLIISGILLFIGVVAALVVGVVYWRRKQKQQQSDDYLPLQ